MYFNCAFFVVETPAEACSASWLTAAPLLSPLPPPPQLLHTCSPAEILRQVESIKTCTSKVSCGCLKAPCHIWFHNCGAPLPCTVGQFVSLKKKNRNSPSYTCKLKVCTYVCTNVCDRVCVWVRGRGYLPGDEAAWRAAPVKRPPMGAATAAAELHGSLGHNKRCDMPTDTHTTHLSLQPWQPCLDVCHCSVSPSVWWELSVQQETQRE